MKKTVCGVNAVKLSIIVPVYNVEKYLAECVDSLVNQTLKDYEIILIDDGSKDSSGKIADEYAGKYPEKIRVLHIDNGGQGRARNFGIDIAQGEFIGFIDSDDWIELDMYEKLCSKADETGADVVVCDFMAKFSDGREEYLPACMQEHWLSSAGSSCNKIFRRDIVGNVRFPGGLWYEDFYFSAMMLLKSKRTEFIKEPLYLYRKGQESTMHNNNASKNLDMLKIMDLLAEYMLPNGFKSDFEFFLINHIVLDSISRIAQQNAENKKEVLGKMRAYVRKYIPDITKCESYKNESRNRRIIMYLNYHGLHDLGQLILKAKNAI